MHAYIYIYIYLPTLNVWLGFIVAELFVFLFVIWFHTDKASVKKRKICGFTYMFVRKNNWTTGEFRPKASSGKYVLYNGHCDLIYNYIIWRHISNLMAGIRFPKFCLSFQPAENVSLDRDVLCRSRTMTLW